MTLGPHEINEIEAISEEICEHVRGICVNLQEFIDEGTLKESEYNEQMDCLRVFLTDVKGQRHLVNQINIMP